MTNEEFKAKWEKPLYIGDSVYVHHDGYHIILETRNGLPTDPSNTIALEPEILENLKGVEEAIRKDIRRVMKLGEFAEKENENS